MECNAKMNAVEMKGKFLKGKPTSIKMHFAYKIFYDNDSPKSTKSIDTFHIPSEL